MLFAVGGQNMFGVLSADPETGVKGNAGNILRNILEVMIKDVRRALNPLQEPRALPDKGFGGWRLGGVCLR